MIMQEDNVSLLSNDSVMRNTSCSCIPCGSKTGSYGFKFHRLIGQEENSPRPVRTSQLSSSFTESRISDFDKVPMDFSELNGKIISDPDEVANCTKEEYFRARAKLRSHSPDRQLANVNVYSVEPWFHYGLTREESNKLLKQHGSKEGAFLVRTSDHLPGCFILCLMHKELVHHFPITCMKDKSSNESYLTLDRGRTKFKDLIQLIEFYQMNHGDYLPVSLKSFVTKSITVPARKGGGRQSSSECSSF